MKHDRQVKKLKTVAPLPVYKIKNKHGNAGSKQTGGGVFKMFINQVKPGGAFRSVHDTETRPHLDSPAETTETEAPPPHPHPHRSDHTPPITAQ